jgi:tryptophan synthase alpha subunit
VYSRPSGYWYALARDAVTGARITDASGYSRENVLRELRGKFAMNGVTIKSIADEDPYAGVRATRAR